MKVRFIALASIALLAAPAVGLTQSPASHDPTTVQGGIYGFDATHTEVMFNLSHLGFSEYFASFGSATGSLQIDPKRIGASHLDVSIPVSSVSTTSPKLDGEFKSGDWLDAGKFPQMTFHSMKITPLGAGRARVEGELTLHGVKRPLTLDARFVGAGINPLDKHYTIGFQATGQLKRSDFGVKTYLPLIGDDVHLNIAASLEKQG